MPQVFTKKKTMLGGSIYFETVITGNGVRVSATGKTAEESRRKAEDKWAARQLGGKPR